VSATHADIFRSFSKAKLEQLAGRIDVCLAKLTEEQVWARGSENENSIANLVLHLCGNVGQWIVSGAGGAPDTRRRDDEFNARAGHGTEALRARLAARVAEASAVIASLSDARLLEPVQVQKYTLPVMEAVYHSVEHFAQHTGQIIFATKMLTGQELGFYTHLKQPTHNEVTP
jgi:uncharacterized damage-inducible protein DinB